MLEHRFRVRRVAGQLVTLLQLQVGEVYRASAIGKQWTDSDADHSHVGFDFDRFREADKVVDLHDDYLLGKEKDRQSGFEDERYCLCRCPLGTEMRKLALDLNVDLKTTKIKNSVPLM